MSYVTNRIVASLVLVFALQTHLSVAYLSGKMNQNHGRKIPKNFTMGYLTGSARLPNTQHYKRPGLLISGAITLAVEEVCFIFV